MRGRRFKTQADINLYIAQGYGQGVGESYKPWLRVQDVPSRGRSRKVHGTKADRPYHLFSDLEYGYFLLLEFSEQVVEIREQFPLLPVAQVQDVARRLGLRYPKFPGTQVPFVMTTDFMVTISVPSGGTVLAPRTTKYEKELCDPKTRERTLEKLEIERVFFKECGVEPMAIVTDAHMSDMLVENLQFLRGATRIERHLLNPEIALQFLDALDQYDMSDRTLSSAIRSASNKLHLPYKDGVALFKHLVWNKAILFNIAESPMKLSDISPPLRLIGLGAAAEFAKAA